MRTRILGLGASIALLVGCSDSLSTDPSALIVTAAVSADSILPGDELLITATAENTGSRRLEFDRSGCLFLYEVRDKRGELVSPAFGCFPILVHEIFEAGEVKQEVFEWSAEIETYQHRFRRSPVPAGPYDVVTYLAVTGGARSDPVAIEVLPTLVLTVRVEPAVASPGDTVSVTTSIANMLREPVQLEVLSVCTFGVRVLREEDFVTDLSGDCTIVDRILALGALGTHEETVFWTTAQPGEFTIEAQLGVPTLKPDLQASARASVR